MGLLKNFVDDISSLKSLKQLLPLELQVMGKVGNYTLESDIMEKILKPKERFTPGCHNDKISLRIIDKKYQRIILYFSLSEYPNCCGKLIMHGIYFTPYLFNSDGGNKIEISDEDGVSMINAVIKVLEEICDILTYTTVDFIVSDCEQAFLFKCVKKAGLKEVSVFQNRRNEYKHTCYTYSLEFKKSHAKPVILLINLVNS